MSNALVKPASVEELLGRLADEYMQRLSRGEQPDLEEYACRHPNLADVIRAVFPSLKEIPRVGREVGGEDPLSGLHVQSGQGSRGTMGGVLGDFRLLRQVGRGGMGVVYEAEQLSLHRRVALKILPLAGVLDERQLTRFRNEALAAATLDHPNIVDVHGVGCERGIHYYAMRFIDGQSLAEVLRDLRQFAGPQVQGTGAAPANHSGHDLHAPGPLVSPPPGGEPAPTQIQACGFPPDAVPTSTQPQAVLSTREGTASREYLRNAARLGMQVAEALDHAHQHGIIHRDIKPGNLMLDSRGKVWVTDFGLAHLETGASLTLSGDLIGTVRYMSPEQALAKRVPIDHRTDVYALGVTLYELLTLEPAFSGNDRQELLRQRV